MSRTLVLALAAALTGIAAAETVRIPLQVSEAFGGRTLVWPVTTGIPLPEGAAKEGFRYRLMDDQGRSVPCHVRPTAWWRRTQSVQWLTLRFVAAPGRRYVLDLGDGIAPASPTRPVGVTETADGLIVDAGTLQATFSRTAASALCRLAVDGVVVCEAGDRPFQSFTDKDGEVHVSGGEGEGRRIVVEERSPAHAVIRCTGFYVGPDGRKAAQYTTRHHFFAGSPFVQVRHAFLVLSDTEGLQFRDIAYRLPMTVPEARRQVAFDSSSAFDGQTHSVAWTPGTRSLSMAQETFRHYGRTESRFRIYEKPAPIVGAGEGEAAERILFAGEQGGQYVHVGAPGSALTVAMRWFWQQFPKEFEVLSDAVVVHLWSPRGGLLDFRAKGCKEFWGDDLLDFWKTTDQGKTIAGFLANSQGFDNAKGLEKSHEFWLWPRAQDATPAQVAEFGRLVEEPVLAIAEPSWNCATGVFESIGPKDAAAFPEMEGFIDDLMARKLQAADLFGDYGWWAFGGNEHAVHAVKDGKLLATPYRFTHATYFQLRSMWALYYRSGDRRILDFLLTRSYHFLDIRVKHVEDARWRRGAWGGYGTMPIFWWSHDTYLFDTIDYGLKEMLWCYAFTGDDRWRDWADMWTEAARAYTARPGWPAWYLDETKAGYTAAWARGVTAFLNTLVALYGYNGDATLGERARELAAAVMDEKSPSGVRQTKDGYYVSEPYYWLNPLLSYAAQFGDPKAVESCRRLTDYLYYTVACRESGPRVSDLATGYALTGDPKFLAEAMLNWRNTLRERQPGMTAALNTREGVRAINLNSDDKTLWEGLPRLVWGLQRQRGSGVPPPSARLMPAISRLVVMDKALGKALRAEVLSSAALERVLDPLGRELPATALKSAHYEHDPKAGFLVTRLAVAADAPAGPYAIHGRDEVMALSGTAERVAAWTPGGISARPGRLAAPLMLPSADGTLSVRVRFPAQATFRNARGESLTPAKAAGQTLEFSGLAAGELIAFEDAQRNYLELVGLPADQRWIGYETPARWFRPEVKLPDVAPLRAVDPKAAFVEGIDGDRPEDRAAHLAGGVLKIPTRAEAAGKDVPLFPEVGKEGTVEFWYCPLWDPNWKERVYFDVDILNVGSVRIRYIGHEQGDYLDFVSHGPRNVGWARQNVRFEPGRWYHIAVSWFPWDKADDKMLVLAYVDGRPIGHVRSGGYVLSTGGWAPNPKVKVAPEVVIGMKGEPALVDELRVSDIARYREMKQVVSYEFDTLPIAPSRKTLAADEHTLLLMRFDGDLRALSSRAPTPVEARDE